MATTPLLIKRKGKPRYSQNLKGFRDYSSGENKTVSKSKLPVIGQDEHFYGYLISLGVGLSSDREIGEWDRNLYAMFESGGDRCVYQVPDHDLFEILSKHLCSMAWIRTNTDEYGYDKLWISKTNGKWTVNLP
jgi:hypothetical protein